MKKWANGIVSGIFEEFMKGVFTFDADIEHRYNDRPVHVHISNQKGTNGKAGA